MRSTAVRFIGRVLIALVALYAANDGLLQAYMHDGSDGIVRQLPARTAMPVLAPAGQDDDRDDHPVLDTATAVPPVGPEIPPRVSIALGPAAPMAAPVTDAGRTRPVARGPPDLLHASA